MGLYRLNTGPFQLILLRISFTEPRNPHFFRKRLLRYLNAILYSCADTVNGVGPKSIYRDHIHHRQKILSYILLSYQLAMAYVSVNSSFFLFSDPTNTLTAVIYLANGS